MEERGGRQGFTRRLGKAGKLGLIQLLLVGAATIFMGCGANGRAGEPILQPTAVRPVLLSSTKTANIQLRPTPHVQHAEPSIIAPTAVFSSPTPLPTFVFPIDPDLRRSADALGVPLVRIDSDNAARWRFERGALPHPIAIARTNEALLLLDHGRLILVPREDPGAARLLLQPGDSVENVPVVEPIAVAVSGADWLVLDRAGDVYRFDGAWRLAWYGRSLENSDGHYYVALGANDESALLVESSYWYAQRIGSAPRIWPLPAQLGVGAAQDGKKTYVLLQSLFDTTGTLLRYENAAIDSDFSSEIAIERVRGVGVSDTAVYVLDWGGRRLLQLDKSGKPVALWQTPPQTVSFWVEHDGSLTLAAPDRVYFVGEAGDSTVLPDGVPLVASAPFVQWDGETLDWVLPIEGTRLTERPLQMPGAPRHYRLGVHEGLDFYWRTGTTVRAVADGVVIRADAVYERPHWPAFAAQKEAVEALGTTPEEALDFYRGRQVWLEHANGTVTRYAHLSEIAAGVGVGTTVVQGQPLGKVGNTGSPVSVNSESNDAHLHLEVWHGDFYLGQFMRPVETWELILALWE